MRFAGALAAAEREARARRRAAWTHLHPGATRADLARAAQPAGQRAIWAPARGKASALRRCCLRAARAQPCGEVASLDCVARVLREMRHCRPVRRVHRFRHGAGGAALIVLDGTVGVLKAWPAGSPIAANLPAALRHMAAMRRKGVAVPRVREEGEADGQRYVVYERLPGRWPPRVTGALLDQLIAVVDAERGSAAGEGMDWPDAVRRMLFEGDPLRDVRPSVLEGHPAGRALLDDARACLAACDPALMAAGDVVHGDFAPENALAERGRLTGVVDWEQSRAGDARFDLIGLLFDVDLGGKAAAAVSARLRLALRQRLPAPLLALYTAVYSVRYAGWAIGTEMEAEVLALVDRLGREFFRAGLRRS